MIVHHVPPERLMPADAAQDFRAVFKELTARERDVFEDLVRSAGQGAQRVGRHWNFSAPAEVVDAGIAPLVASGSEADRQRLRRAFVAKACLTSVGQFSQNMPDSVLSLYPRFYARIARYLKSSEVYTYDDYSKDVRYALNMTVPAGLLEIDLESRIGPKLVLRNLKTIAGVPPALSWLRHRAWGTWYNDHLDLRGEPDFTPRGWTGFFQRAAEMLELNRHIRGVQGVGWLYDPALARVSPHLAYIRKTQVENGAFLIRIGQGEEHTRRATLTSQTRRRLVEAGEYLPACYVLAWPRESLIAWANKVKRQPAFGFGGQSPQDA